MKLFNVIAYHSTKQKGLKQFDDFTGENKAYSGEGAMVHGWGLYLQADKELNIERYKSAVGTPEKVNVTLGDVTYTGTFLVYNDRPLWIKTLSDGKFYYVNDMWEKDALDQLIYCKDTETTIDVLKHMFVEDQKEYNLPDDYLKMQIDLLQGKDAVIEKIESDKAVQYKVEIPPTFTLISEGSFGNTSRDARQKFEDAYVDMWMKLKPRTKKPEKFRQDFKYKVGSLYWDFASFRTELCSWNGLSQKEFSEYLLKHGIDGVKYYGDTDGTCYVIFNCAGLNILEEE